MKKDLSGRLALDTSALIELVFFTRSGLKLKTGVEAGLVEACATRAGLDRTYWQKGRIEKYKTEELERNKQRA